MDWSGWYKFFAFSKRFWLLVLPLGVENLVALMVKIGLLDAASVQSVTTLLNSWIVRGIELVGLWLAAKGGAPLTLSWAKSGGVPVAPFANGQPAAK